MNVDADFHSPTSSPTVAAPPTTALPHTQPPTPGPPRSITLPPCPPDHPHQSAAARGARQPTTRAPSPLACLRRPPTRRARPSSQVSHPLSHNARTTQRPGIGPQFPTGSGGPLRMVDNTGPWPPPAGATTQARGRGCSWSHKPFSARRPQACAPRSPQASSALRHNSRCPTFAVWGIAVACKFADLDSKTPRADHCLSGPLPVSGHVIGQDCCFWRNY